MKKNAKKSRGFLCVFLTLCMVFGSAMALMVPVGASDEKGYSEPLRAYYYANKSENNQTYAVLFGSDATPKTNYALVYKTKDSTAAEKYDVISGEQLEKEFAAAAISKKLTLAEMKKTLKAYNEKFGINVQLIPNSGKSSIIKHFDDTTADPDETFISDDLAFFPDMLHYMANKTSPSFKYIFSTVSDKNNNSVKVRITFYPAKATKGFVPMGTLKSQYLDVVKEKFAKHYTNKVAMVDMNQYGSYGMKVKIAAKVDLTGLDTKKLIFTSYDDFTNKNVLIKNTNYYIDKNGYLHFDTSLGGTIIISDKPLTKK